MGAGSQPGVTIIACHCAEVLGSVASRATPVAATVTGSLRVAPQAMSDEASTLWGGVVVLTVR